MGGGGGTAVISCPSWIRAFVIAEIRMEKVNLGVSKQLTSKKEDHTGAHFLFLRVRGVGVWGWKGPDVSMSFTQPADVSLLDSALHPHT